MPAGPVGAEADPTKILATILQRPAIENLVLMKIGIGSGSHTGQRKDEMLKRVQHDRSILPEISDKFSDLLCPSQRGCSPDMNIRSRITGS